ncbi:MAG: hypothetical protein ACTSPB_11895 [Candidatus Thorarchaeota archaeon]
MTYPYFNVTGNPLIDSLLARPDQLENPSPDFILPVAVAGFLIAVFVGLLISRTLKYN